MYICPALFKMKLFVTVFVFSLLEISYRPVFATAVAKILNQKEKNEFLDSWKSPKDISDKFPYYVSGFDVEKRPVFVLEVGKWPLHYFVEKGGQDLENLSTYLNKFFRRVEIGPKAFFNESEIGAPDTVVIVDWEDFSLKQLIHAPTVQYILHHFTSFQRLQDSLAYGYYLNVNAVASQFIALAKPILGSALERVEVLGTQKIMWIPKLLHTINADQLPPWYGGAGNDTFQPVAVYG